jgi:hypothetical protein
MRLEKQFTDWEKEIKSKIAVSERISEKTKAEERQLTKEMQKRVSLKIISVTQFVYFKNGVLWDVTPCCSCKNQRFR